MDKRYQVFVSSTYEDLQEERKEVMQALLELDCMPAGMELFPASNEDQWTLIKRVIDDCDYYLLIIGGRYGSVNKEGKSYTQMEFEYALNQGKPIISFLPKHPENIPTKKTDKETEKQKKIEEFKVLARKKTVRFWDTPVELGSVVSRSMVKLIKQFPTEGWVKANSAVDEVALQEISRLQKENKELNSRLEAIATEAPVGTENFSQGEDSFNFSITFKASDEEKKNFYDCKSSINFTWNELFSSVAPHMIDECNDSIFEKAIEELCSKKEEELKENETFKGLINFNTYSVKEEFLNRIKIQFKALGLIKLSEKKRSTKDYRTYWTLTPYGDYIMTQLLAIRRD